MAVSQKAKPGKVGKMGFSLPKTLTLLAMSTCAAGAPPEGFYDAAEGQTGGTLERTLHSLIDNHRVFTYSEARDILKTLDLAPGSRTQVELTYSSLTRGSTEFGGGSGGFGNSGDWNREHCWPRSYGIFSSGDDNSDLFNLRPCDVDTNSERGSRYYDDVPGGSTYSGADGVMFSGDRWEPQDSEKGDLARGCFYMAVRYDGSDPDTSDLNLGDDPSRDASRFGILSRLLEWHRSDPVDEVELLRNDTIANQYQRNRNPFIDRPEFAELIYLPRFPGRDSDMDGLLDLWEWRELGTDSETGTNDDDGDGVVNLLEFAFGMDPGVADPGKLPMLQDGVLIYRQASEASALNLIPEVSTSLTGGSWEPYLSGDVSEEVDGVQTWSIPIGELVGRRYFRVRVSN